MGPARFERYVIGRENNVVRVDFRREPDPPAPRFPGAGALREVVAEEHHEPARTWRAA
jgi:hypothetical protein